MKQRVVILVGLPGSGKSTASSFFHQQGIPVVRMGDVTDQLLAEQGLQINEENEKEIRGQLRRHYGENIYARRTADTVKKLEEQVIVIEGMRSEVELAYFRSCFEDVVVVFIDTPDGIRYERLLHRPVRPLNHEEAIQRDEWEKHSVDTLRLKEIADITVENAMTKEDFFTELQKI